jgi:hypothetical protein
MIKKIERKAQQGQRQSVEAVDSPLNAPGW